MLNRRQAFIGHNKTIKMVPVYHEQQRQLAYIEQILQILGFCTRSFQIHSISLGHVYFIYVLQIITYLGLLYTIIYYLELQITELLFTDTSKK